MKRALLILLFPLSALAHNYPGELPKPPQSQPTPPHCSCWWQPVLTAGAISAMIGVPLYISHDEREQKRVDLKPTSDGKGARIVIEVRQ